MIAAMFGMVGLSILELVLSMFGNGTGLFGVTGIGMLTPSPARPSASSC